MGTFGVRGGSGLAGWQELVVVVVFEQKRQMSNVRWKKLIFHLSFDIFHLSFENEQTSERVRTRLPAAAYCLLLTAYCLLLTDAGCTVNVISVRRFFARPLRVVFAASGFAAPIPLACTRDASTPAA